MARPTLTRKLSNQAPRLDLAIVLVNSVETNRFDFPTPRTPCFPPNTVRRSATKAASYPLMPRSSPVVANLSSAGWSPGKFERLEEDRTLSFPNLLDLCFKFTFLLELCEFYKCSHPTSVKVKTLLVQLTQEPLDDVWPLYASTYRPIDTFWHVQFL